MSDDIITKDEAIDRKKAGLPCETLFESSDSWCETMWRDFDFDTAPVFRKPPEPRRDAMLYWLYDGRAYMHKIHEKSLRVREVLPGDVVVSESALASALNAMLTQFGMDEDEWNKPTFDQARRALGLIADDASALGEGS